MEVGEGLAELADESLDVLGAAFFGVHVGLVGEVAVEDLLHQVQLPLVAHLFDVAPKRCLVLFFRYTVYPFRFSYGHCLC